MPSYSKLRDCLQYKNGNYIFPFFWQHGEDDETLVREIKAIYESGVRALCVESRTHEGFCEDSWWHTMEVILEECKARDMRVWILDDKHFPSGYANGIISKKYPEHRMWAVTERHVDISGPEQDARVRIVKTSPDDTILGVYAWKRVPYCTDLEGEPIDLTENVCGDFVKFDVPAGCYRVFYILKSQSGFHKMYFEYADKLTEFGGDAFIEAVYEPHYEHLGKYFGNVIAGFFSDEPCFGNNHAAGFPAALGRKYSHFPYTEEVIEMMTKSLGFDPMPYLASLWFGTTDQTASKIRLAYMDVITRLYSKNFTYKLGDWCRAHGVEYIGHIIEDMHQHIGTSNSTGHYFRSLDGQDMAGIDVVLCQIVPGMTDYPSKYASGWDETDETFYHFMLPKLGVSHSHIQSAKKGRTMCEIYGAYGWAEGLKMMKWLTDFMLVRGVNNFVPHAFTPKDGDTDCPPHFYAGGHNPEYKKFKLLMNYMNRVSHILNDGHQVTSCAVLYYAEAAWSGGNFMRTDAASRKLTETQLDFDIVSIDYLAMAKVINKNLYVGDGKYPCLVIPFADFQPSALIEKLVEFGKMGLPIFVIDRFPRISETGADSKKMLSKYAKVISLDDLDRKISKLGARDITLSRAERFLRVCHISHDDGEYYFFTNEDNHNAVDTYVTLDGFKGGKYIVYDAMDNKALTKTSNGKIHIALEPYQSIMIVTGAEMDGLDEEKIVCEIASDEIDAKWDISICTEEDYPNFTPIAKGSELFNINGTNEYVDFAGHVRYEAMVSATEIDYNKIVLDLGNVGECASVWVNGNEAGDKIAPPYQFDVSKLVRIGDNKLLIETTSHLGYKIKDNFSQNLIYEPTGLLGPVRIKKYK